MKYLREIVHDSTLRAFAASTFSFALTVVFMGYNVFLAFAYYNAWNGSIAGYYAMLVGLRAYILWTERTIRRDFPKEEGKEKRKKAFYIQSLMLLILDFVIIAPISIMVLHQRAVSYSRIPAIATAVYMTLKVIAVTRAFVKSRRQPDLCLRMLKNVNFIEMLVSILSLQYILIMNFGGGDAGRHDDAVCRHKLRRLGRVHLRLRFFSREGRKAQARGERGAFTMRSNPQDTRAFSPPGRINGKQGAAFAWTMYAAATGTQELFFGAGCAFPPLFSLQTARIPL